MPLTEAGALAIGAGVSALSQGGQMLMTGKMNRKTRAWNEKMMHRQREWALSDWQMQNQYNSPAAQMARLKEAGLNPNLVYGGGSATQDSGVVRNTDAPAWNPDTPNLPEIPMGEMVSRYYNIQQQKAQTDLLKQQAVIAERDQQLKELAIQAQTLGIIIKDFDFGQKKLLAPYQLAFQKEKVSVAQQSIMESLARMSQMSWNQNMNQQRLQMDKTRLASDMTTADLQREIMKVSANKGKAEIEQIRQNIENMKKTGEFQRMTNELQEKMMRLNLNASDPAYYRLFTAIADKLGQK